MFSFFCISAHISLSLKPAVHAGRDGSLTQSNAAVLQQVAQVVKHGFLVLTADPTEVAQEATAAGHHFWEGDFLQEENIKDAIKKKNVFYKDENCRSG